MQLHVAADRPTLIGMANSKRRWMQFSLRTGFIIITLLCVALSLWAVPAERQRRAVAAIEAVGGGFRYNPWFIGPEPFPKRALRGWLPRDYFDRLKALRLSSGPFAASKAITDDDLANVRALRHLEELFIVGTEVTDAGLAHLAPLTRLKKLGLANTKITDIGLSQVQGRMNLRELWLTNTNVTDAGLLHLHGLTHLETLGLGGTRITDAGLPHLLGLTRLRSLWLDGTHVTDAGGARLRQALPKCQITGP